MRSRLLAQALIAMLSQNGVRVIHESEVPRPFPDRPPPLPPMLTSRRGTQTHWGDDQARRSASAARSEIDAARVAAAQAKRDRKAAKRLRDARGNNEA